MEAWPEFVVVPAARGWDGVELETHYAAGGVERVLPVFSSVGALVAVLGHDRPWVCVALADAREAAAGAGLARVVIDPEAVA